MTLLEEICSFASLYRAWRRARSGKRFTAASAAFAEGGVGVRLLDLAEEVLSGAWRPGPYASHRITDSKPRIVHEPDFPDRVLQQGIFARVGPGFHSSYLSHTYSGIEGRGQHAALDHVQHHCRRRKFVLQCDVHRYFASIDHELLMAEVARHIDDEGLLEVFRRILDSQLGLEGVAAPYRPFAGDDLFSFTRPRGLALGSLFCQEMGNLFLDSLDHLLHDTGLPWARYMDDFVILSDSKRDLHELRREVARHLEMKRLSLHPARRQVFPVRCGIPFLGFRVFPGHRKLLRANIRRFKARVRVLQKDYAEGRVSLHHVSSSMRSWYAHARHGNTYRFRCMLVRNIVWPKPKIAPEGR